MVGTLAQIKSWWSSTDHDPAHPTPRIRSTPDEGPVHRHAADRLPLGYDVPRVELRQANDQPLAREIMTRVTSRGPDVLDPTQPSPLVPAPQRRSQRSAA